MSHKASKRELRYAAEHFGEVHHTTLDPEGPGVVRIHLVPPKIADKEIGASVAIINGQDVVPVNRSWSIILCELIANINEYKGREITDADAEDIKNKTCAGVKKVYPLISKKKILGDIYTIMRSFSQIARGETPDEGVGAVSLGDYAPYMRAPHRMDILVSPMTRGGKWNCNLKCVHCYAAGQTCAEEPELSKEDLFRVIDKCREIGVPQITFTGGEPTLRSDLFELIDHAKWFITRLNTNGVLLTPEYCAGLRRSSLDSLQITFYSADREIHNRLVGADGYDRTLAGIENALAANISVSVNTPLCTENRDYVKTLELLHEKGVRYVTCSGLITTGNAEKPESERLQLTNAEMRGILEKAVAYCFENGMEISFTSPGWADADFCRELKITTPSCGACLSNMAITPGGKVVPCQSWLSDEPLGDFLGDDWEKIWESDVCRKHRAFSAQTRCECPLRIMNGRRIFDETNCM